MYKCPYSGREATDAGDGILMCDICDCFGWSPESLRELNDPTMRLP